ncbi:hypothetical protein GHT06_011754 [Daphnia sinensis]|uniref:Uncharacterized protein n=1 Tax=Daphnia sinensis TaxID=1820382 RepID=A0AAD5KUM3_9CRUS|nr:hypothetical protein GHT06_011754 [Daphnia sinensis]
MIPGKVVSRVKVSYAVVGCKQKYLTLDSSDYCTLFRFNFALVSFPLVKSDDGPLLNILQNGFTVVFLC